ncbi:hypothetical protein CKY47_31050 [Saccharothrix yanglingensis]|uniref:DUF1062 domain-containing protein n=1 Tax=Saccharothrix yanglingensis TaxID=659496 RepID=A0ABU0X869_9PSEU|nr:hypothetical protein [Saccharothrix yanglingensis]
MPRRAGRRAPLSRRRPYATVPRGGPRRAEALPVAASAYRGSTRAVSELRSTRVPVEGGGIDRKALWVVRELGLPAIVKACASCRSTRHHPTGKFRVNANGKLLDVWLLIRCELCGRASKVPVHERVRVQSLDHERLPAFEGNDPAMVRRLTVDAAFAGRAGHRLDWSGTWELETDVPFYEFGRDDPTPLEVVVRFELPAPVRVGKLLTAGFGLSRPAVRDAVASGRIHLPLAVDAKVREDFTFFVTAPAPPPEAAGGRG